MPSRAFFLPLFTNVLLYDDTGLTVWEPFGGRIEMPTLKRLTDNGLMYSQRHTTAVCYAT